MATPTPAKAPTTTTTGLTAAPFKWATLPGTAAATNRVDWIQRQAAAGLAVGRAQDRARAGQAQAAADERFALAKRGLEWARDRRDTGLQAAGRGVGRNPAMLGRMLEDTRQDYLTDAAELARAKQARIGAVTELLRETEADRRLEQSNINLEATALADPAKLIKGVRK